MVMTGEMDWIFWTVGGLLGLGGLTLLLWSLFADRSKGRKRCPKCWYNMAHTPSLTCSECGYTAKREKKLHKTHRRWRWAFVAVFLLICSATSSLTPKVKRDGWYSIIPTTVLIFLASEDYVPSITGQTNVLFGQITNNANPSSELTKRSYKRSWLWKFTNNDNPSTELAKRIYKKSLWSWQWRLLAARIHPEDDASWIIHSSMRHDWPVDKPLYALAQSNFELSQLTWFGECELRIQVSSDLPGTGMWSCELDSFYGYPSTGSFWAGKVQFNNSTFTDWNDPSFLVGDLPEGEHTIMLKVVLQRRDSDKVVPWSIMWEGGIEHTVNIQGTISDVLKPATNLRLENDLQPSALKVSSDGVLIQLSHLIDFNAWITLALQFDLTKNGEVIRSTQAWWSPVDLAMSRMDGFPMPERVAWDRPISFIDSPATLDTSWALRVRAVPELALRATALKGLLNYLESEMYLSEILLDGDFIPGDVTYQLRWIDDQRLWIVDP